MYSRTSFRTMAHVLRALGKLGPYTSAPPGEPAPLAESPSIDSAAVRAWAAEQGIEVPPRGRISADVLTRYRTREL